MNKINATDKRALIAKLNVADVLPKNRGLYYGGAWHDAQSGVSENLSSPSTGDGLGAMSIANEFDVDAAVNAAHKGYLEWRTVKPFERARILREAAQILRDNAIDLAMIDAADCGNPVREMTADAEMAAASLDYFSGLVLETKGDTIPVGEGMLNFTLREPLGVVARIIPFNHPLLFAAHRCAAPLAAGNSIIIKPPHQAPLSTLRLAELWDGLLPAGVYNVLTGAAETGQALVEHEKIAKIALTGSVATGRKILHAAAERILPVTLELGGKNALIAFPDADPDEVASGAVRGMNFTWCGQSCGSTSRVFLHESMYDDVVEKMSALCGGIKPGLPTEFDTDMGAIISQSQFEKVMGFIESATAEGARLVAGGGRPDNPSLEDGFFIEPTMFADVEPNMRIAKEEIFGPVVSVFKWSNEDEMFDIVNNVDYGLKASIWTNDVNKAITSARRVEAGFIWINNIGAHFLGAPFGGYKQSGLGREESLEEILAYTQLKNVNINLKG